MSLLLVALTSFAAALLTFFSGFGLGTILLPVMALFLPPTLAVAATAAVHLFNSLYKCILAGRYARWEIVWKFGLPALLGAAAGALLLVSLAEIPPIHTYTLAGRTHEISPIKLMLAALIAAFALAELAPLPAASPRWLPLGGLVAGFFGGLSGHQGALRSAFLIRGDMQPRAFVGTNAVLAAMVDLSRLPVYLAAGSALQSWQSAAPLACSACLGALGGTTLGLALLGKVTLPLLRRLVAVALVLLAIALGAGLV